MKTFSTLLDFIHVALFFQFYCYPRSYIWAAFPGKTMFEKINAQIKLSFGNTDNSFSLKNGADQKNLPSHLEWELPNKHHNKKTPKPHKARDFRPHPTEWTGDCLNITEQRCRNCRKRTSGQTEHRKNRWCFLGDIYFPRPAAFSEGAKPACQSWQFCDDVAELPRKKNSSSIT